MERYRVNGLKFKVVKQPAIVSTPEHLLRQLRVYEELLSKSTDSLPDRHQIQLNAITTALAIVNGRNRILQEDIETISWLSNWINYDFKDL